MYSNRVLIFPQLGAPFHQQTILENAKPGAPSLSLIEEEDDDRETEWEDYYDARFESDMWDLEP